jgi:hypothetical protein
MNWYRYITDPHAFETFEFDRRPAWDLVDMLTQGAPIGEKWKPAGLHRLSDSPGVEGDFPTLSNYSKIPLMTLRAWRELEPILGGSCEALPVKLPSGGKLVIINVTDIVPCVDLAKSKLTKNAVSGDVERVFQYSLKDRLMSGKNILWTPLKSGSDLLVSEEFRAAVERAGLKGLLFEPLPMVGGRPKTKP